MIPDGFTVVAGSLGDQGGAVARTLKRHGRHVRALTHSRWSPAARLLRDDGVDILSDDLENPEVAVRDLAGAAHVFAAFTPFDEGGLQTELRRVRNLAWASVRTGVQHFVYSSVGDPQQDKEVTADGVWGVEGLLQQFDLPLTLLRPAFFMENVELALCRNAHGGLALRMPLSEQAVVHWIAVEDVGTLARLAYDRPAAFGPGPVQLGSDELSFAEAATMIGDVLGEEVRYEQIALGEVKDQHARGMYRWFQSYPAHYHPDSAKLRRIHPGLLTFRQWLESGRLDLRKVEQGTSAAA